MRKPDDYVAAGRSNPLDPQQMQEHPYDFVSLPNCPARGHAVAHGQALEQGRFDGQLHLVYVTKTPLHVGSGVLETAAECGLRGGTVPVRGMARRGGRPVLPGSSWKGAIRARFEAITDSRLALADDSSKEKASKVPDALKSPTAGGSYQVRIKDPRVTSTLKAQEVRGTKDLQNLSPADALFGCLGYRGRLFPMEGVIEGPAATEPLRITPLDSPMMHRLAKPGKSANVDGRKIEITEVEGRKFYYDGPLVESRMGRFELLDTVPPGCRIVLRVRFDAATPAEIGALLVASGHGSQVGIVRFGGYKPAGLGRVRLEQASVTLGGSRHRHQAGQDTTFDLDSAIAAAHGSFLNAQAIKELHTVTTRRRTL
jgi:CRISPR/Cas system CSM-associated protein Csm3 (group 7 of RAMP superfamily)